MDNKKYQIVLKKPLKPDITLIEVYAPLIAKKAKAGQFIIFRVDAEGERVPLTIAYTDKEKGTVAIIFQKVGASTLALDALNEGECLHDFVGPLGVPTHIEAMGKKVAVVGGGAGCAIAYPIAKALHEHGVEVHTIAGFRNKDLIILEDEMSKACTELHMCTDIGDYGFLNTPLPVADLSSATYIGTYAFMKPEETAFTVKLGDQLQELGDNPFAMCLMEPFSQVTTTDFNGTVLEEYNYTYDISQKVTVIDGSLYQRLERGYWPT